MLYTRHAATLVLSVTVRPLLPPCITHPCRTHAHHPAIRLLQRTQHMSSPPSSDACYPKEHQPKQEYHIVSPSRSGPTQLKTTRHMQRLQTHVHKGCTLRKQTMQQLSKHDESRHTPGAQAQPIEAPSTRILLLVCPLVSKQT
jgi:hypothetical protein